MPKGRKPTPTRLKLLAGNPGKRTLSKTEPAPPPLTVSEPPDWFNEEARRQWFRLVPELKRLGLLTVLDQSAIEICCQSIADYVRYCRAIDAQIVRAGGAASGELMATPGGFVAQSPFTGMRNKAADLARKYLTEFGLTPSSRVRVSAPMGGGADALDELLKGRPE